MTRNQLFLGVLLSVYSIFTPLGMCCLNHSLTDTGGGISDTLISTLFPGEGLLLIYILIVATKLSHDDTSQ